MITTTDLIGALGRKKTIFYNVNQCHHQRKTLSALAGLLDADGKLAFSYNTADTGFDDTVYHTGAIAWVGYSLVFYQKACGDGQFQTTAYQVAAHLVPASYAPPSVIRLTSLCPPPPLDPAANPDVVVASCYP